MLIINVEFPYIPYYSYTITCFNMKYFFFNLSIRKIVFYRYIKLCLKLFFIISKGDMYSALI